MQTEIRRNPSLVTPRSRRARLVTLLLSLPLCVVACATDAADAPDESGSGQALGPNCHVLRPYGWSSGNVLCNELKENNTPIDLAPGERATFRGVMHGPGTGQGFVTVLCHTNGDGLWDEINKLCKKGPPDEP